MIPQSRLTQTYVLVLATSAFACSLSGQDISKIEDAAILGKWTAKAQTKNGPVTLAKEHSNGTTTLTAYDAANRVLYSKVSVYRTERHGNVKVFVFFDSKFTAGPDAGRTDKKTRSYVYRVDGKKFFEVRGMIVGEDEPPVVIIWEREESPET